MAAEQTPGTPPPAATETPKPAARAPLADRMREAGWDPAEDETSPASPDAEPDKGSGPAPKKAAAPKKKPAEKAASPAADEKTEPDAKPEPEKTAETEAEKLGARGLLEKLAKEQGFVIEDGKITTKQHAEFRLLKKEQREALSRAEQEAMGRIQKAQGELEERFKRVEAFEGALKGRDHQGLAKALGYENWDKLQEDVIAWNADPNYQSMKELKEWKAQQEREAEQAAQERQRTQQEQARAQAEQKYIGDLSGVMKASTDPLVSSMSDDPLFLRAVYRIQQENWDGRETVTPEQAVRMAANGSRVTLGEELKALHARLDKAFGKKPEPEKPPAPKPKIASAPKPGPSVPASKGLGRNERLRAYSDRLSEAVERDRKSGGTRY